ncbi:DNA polymerase III subunit delta' [Emcibacteraceae bacterium]|mgnify:CR=1 FL=1|jgi:DNA polymerase-3 subunit delta'|uniref:DNA polymerase III subunit delta' n=1 Tax=Pseudemcibacter sp. TaxID=2943293 RepID=UPI00230E34F6|nr:DNA polymerase III subunit delta' [Emcibacteraceae bacterium]MDA9769446.1 DNA polymerase III subunit delta' [Emcibacteraceae bacterium]MDG1020662.1 DNA polymerase III subunit delta' [Emcibacteraceae bacterium]MDG1727896.1 DNA polymerase III subunit delta' [Emcibacteraceae bacterium]
MDSEEALIPRNTIELVGHEHAEQLFLDAFNAEKIHHAWMITGPKGIGKATLAYKMARFLLNNPPEDDQGPGLFGDVLEKAALTSLETDLESQANHLVNAGSNPDLMITERTEDPKTGKMRSNILVDDVRKINQFFHKTSSDGGWRVAIVDTADEMNRNAANAILKILEEPPKNSILIILAHAPGRLLPTIKSRCRMLPLKPLKSQTVKEILQKNYPDKEENIIDGYVALSNGSPGYAISLIEHQGLKVYREILGLLSTMPNINVPLMHDFAGAITTKKSGDTFLLFSEMLSQFISRMVRHVSYLNTGHTHNIKEALTEEFKLMEELGEIIPLDQWAGLWEKISEKMKVTDQLNMDRKQTVIDILNMINSALKTR